MNLHDIPLEKRLESLCGQLSINNFDQQQLLWFHTGYRCIRCNRIVDYSDSHRWCADRLFVVSNYCECVCGTSSAWLHCYENEVNYEDEETPLICLSCDAGECPAPPSP